MLSLEDMLLIAELMLIIFSYSLLRACSVDWPVSPNPQTTIAFWATSVEIVASTALAVTVWGGICSDTSSVDIITSPLYAFENLSATCPNKGVTAMVMRTIAVNRPPKSGGSTSKFSARASTTNANSPPPANNRATLIPSAGVNRFGSIHRGTLVASNIVEALSNTREETPASIVGSSVITRLVLKLVPASMKNIPKSIPLKGEMSAWIWAR
mmetsp:Transcript_35357/g.35563  ORF Transcript_35357/g.35563 Transcript_35357/m.35563 type:complete len:212 (-) Transcript_35357:43-678(-)